MLNKHEEFLNITTGVRVLVLDDESYIRGLFSRWLTEAGFACDEARDTREACELLRQKDFQLATVDVRMPGEFGLDLVHQLKREFPDLVILMVTGLDVTAQAVHALTRGAFGYLIKPVDRENLLYQVRSGLALRQRQIDDREYLQRLEQFLEAQQRIAAHTAHKPLKSQRSSNLREARWTEN
jgi:putative two-component system response regulator